VSITIDRIGDKDDNSPAARAYSEMAKSFRRVIDDPMQLHVDGLMVPVVTSQGELTFGTYATVDRGPLEPEELSDTSGVVPLQDPSMGSYPVDFGPLPAGLPGFVVSLNFGALRLVFDQSIDPFPGPTIIRGRSRPHTS
jgi:hypothetical protein